MDEILFEEYRVNALYRTTGMHYCIYSSIET